MAIDRIRLAGMLVNRVPESSRSYCVDQIVATPVSLAIVKKRNSKWGDYRIRPDRPPKITLNADLPQAFFLLTLLHELAHHHVYLNYKRNAAPHGPEWKAAFAKLTAPLLTNTDVFGDELTPLLRRHMRNPRANATADQELYRAYLKLNGNEQPLVSSLASGCTFVFRNRAFTVKTKKGKRIVCECVHSRRTYLFQPSTPVETAEALIQQEKTLF